MMSRARHSQMNDSQPVAGPSSWRGWVKRVGHFVAHPFVSSRSEDEMTDEQEAAEVESLLRVRSRTRRVKRSSSQTRSPSRHRPEHPQQPRSRHSRRPHRLSIGDVILGRLPSPPPSRNRRRRRGEHDNLAAQLPPEIAWVLALETAYANARAEDAEQQQRQQRRQRRQQHQPHEPQLHQAEVIEVLDDEPGLPRAQDAPVEEPLYEPLVLPNPVRREHFPWFITEARHYFTEYLGLQGDELTAALREFEETGEFWRFPPEGSHAQDEAHAESSTQRAEDVARDAIDREASGPVVSGSTRHDRKGKSKAEEGETRAGLSSRYPLRNRSHTGEHVGPQASGSSCSGKRKHEDSDDEHPARMPTRSPRPPRRRRLLPEVKVEDEKPIKSEDISSLRASPRPLVSTQDTSTMSASSYTGGRSNSHALPGATGDSSEAETRAGSRRSPRKLRQVR
ncbi:hypothetical protein CERSUDRAFT_115717 [Gelatoporia subvermispora B]|uniref:Uncharacterized protein n=1 Tax=Ceriporiopsis subvermispora (strain B) TaxID=914234 RepID=M2RAF5_CERS8|nr:hypothetical protein CERSUDRAFT_115717 [Gelatoporia subvermispora B]